MSDDLFRRAVAAYFRSGANMQPTEPKHITHKDKDYVVLHNSTHVLAVYRVTNQGQLKGLRRWPKEVTEGLV